MSAALIGCGPETDDPPAGIDLTKPSKAGWQVTTGDFQVPQGEEVQDCYFYDVPFDEPVWVKRIAIKQNEGSHHMNAFRVRTIQKLDGKPGDVVVGDECWNSPNWADWPLIMNSQTGGETDWTLPEGVAMRFEPLEKIMIQTHYVNASTQKTPVGGNVLMEFYRTPEPEVEHELGTAFATNQSLRICPGEKDKRYEATCRFGRDEPVTLIGANGHFHSRGRKFTINDFDPFEGKGKQFYESKSWDDPPMLRDLNVKIPAKGGISYACEFTAPQDTCGDPDDDCCFTFGGFVEYQEHCNAFVYFYPRGNTDIACF